MLKLFLDWHGRAVAAVAAGVPLRAVLDTGTGARLARMGQIPAEGIREGAAALRAELEAALGRLEAE
jgi:V/A-type H+-transporting ATPase subunit A